MVPLYLCPLLAPVFSVWTFSPQVAETVAFLAGLSLVVQIDSVELDDIGLTDETDQRQLEMRDADN